VLYFSDISNKHSSAFPTCQSGNAKYCSVGGEEKLSFLFRPRELSVLIENETGC
jgi:hypothetical protein